MNTLVEKLVHNNLWLMAILLSSAGPQPASGGAGSSGRHHPQTDRPHPGGGPEWLAGRAAGAESTGTPLFFFSRFWGCIEVYTLTFNIPLWFAYYVNICIKNCCESLHTMSCQTCDIIDLFFEQVVFDLKVPCHAFPVITRPLVCYEQGCT